MSMACDQLFDPELDNTCVSRVPNKNAQTKARASLPDVLALKQVDGRIGIFTKVALSQATQFGPLEAPLVTESDVGRPVFRIKLDVRKYRRNDNRRRYEIYHAMTDENLCNWMMFVRPAQFFVEQNLCAHQKEDFIYFTTTRDIPPGEELKVWYSPTYAQFMSAPLLTNFPGSSIKNPLEKDGLKRARTSRRMQQLQSTMFHERDVRSVPPKKRGWRRTKEKRIDMFEENISLSQRNQAQNPAAAKSVFKPHVCATCGKSFHDKTKLKIHSVVHSDRRDFLCHQCGSTFKRRDKLNDHMTKVHGRLRTSKLRIEKSMKDMEGYDFRCVDCKLGFKRRGMLIVHMTKKHPDISIDSVEDLTRPTFKTVWNFQCPYCVKVYKSSTKRKLHIEKQHPGRALPKSLKKRKGEPSFQRERAGVFEKGSVQAEPICCPYCDRQYSARHKRDKHVREKHGDKIPSHPDNTNDIPHVYHIERQPYADIGQQELTPNLENDVIHEDPDAAQSLYSLAQMPSSSDNHIEEEVYDQDSTSLRPVSIELSDTHQALLSRGATELQPSSSSQHSQQYQDFRNPPPKAVTYARYPPGRKRMLKSYEDSQNQQLPHTVSELSTQPTRKQMPCKTRLLRSEASWRSENWQREVDPCMTNSITELGQSTEPSNNLYPSQSLVSMLDSQVGDDELLMQLSCL